MTAHWTLEAIEELVKGIANVTALTRETSGGVGMGDRYFLTVICPKCKRKGEEVYYAPTCGFTTWRCSCGGLVNLEEYSDISPVEASNKEELKAIVTAANQLKLPPPKNPLGYTDEELREVMTPNEYSQFCAWIMGQTRAIDEEGNSLSYPWDVVRFLKRIRYGKPIYFD